MQYMLLINEDESLYQGPEGEALEAHTLEKHMAFAAALQAKGVEFSGERLKGAETATTLQHGDGDPVLRDGPFAETHEELGGFYIIDVANHDEAVEWARMLPIAGNGGIEIRPVWKMG